MDISKLWLFVADVLSSRDWGLYVLKNGLDTYSFMIDKNTKTFALDFLNLNFISLIEEMIQLTFLI